MLLVAVTLVLAGCWHAWSPMRAAPDASLHAPPAVNAARVVFVRERIHPPDEPHGIAANPSPVHVID